MTEPICEVIITAGNEDWLISFTRSLVEDRLVACGQHIVPIRSVYRWDGKTMMITRPGGSCIPAPAWSSKSSIAPARHTRTTWPAFSPSRLRPELRRRAMGH